jgi:hypothetical protein
MKTIKPSELSLCFTKDDIEFTLGRIIQDCEWEAFLDVLDIIPTATRDRALAALAVEFQAFTGRDQHPTEVQFSASVHSETCGGIEHEDDDNHRFWGLVAQHQRKIDQRILKLLAISNVEERDIQLNAFEEALEDAAHVLHTAKKFLEQEKVLATGGKVRKNHRDDLASAMESLERSFPGVFEQLTGNALVAG